MSMIMVMMVMMIMVVVMLMLMFRMVFMRFFRDSTLNPEQHKKLHKIQH
jgi:NADH:ubiquinone oxidoreductase subunit 5 (subunit L)/multisubunit Na+/H+ antiporter MnhA subunit